MTAFIIQDVESDTLGLDEKKYADIMSNFMKPPSEFKRQLLNTLALMALDTEAREDSN